MSNYNFNKNQIIQDDLQKLGDMFESIEENSMLFKHKEQSAFKNFFKNKCSEFMTFFKALFFIEQSLEPITNPLSIEYIGRFLILNFSKLLPSILMFYSCYQFLLCVSSWFKLSWIKNLTHLPPCLQMQTFSIGALTVFIAFIASSCLYIYYNGLQHEQDEKTYNSLQVFIGKSMLINIISGATIYFLFSPYYTTVNNYIHLHPVIFGSLFLIILLLGAPSCFPFAIYVIFCIWSDGTSFPKTLDSIKIQIKEIMNSDIGIDTEFVTEDNNGSWDLSDCKDKLIKFKNDAKWYGHRLKNNKHTPKQYKKLLDKAIENIDVLIEERKEQEEAVFEEWKESNPKEYKRLQSAREEKQREMNEKRMRRLEQDRLMHEQKKREREMFAAMMTEQNERAKENQNRSDERYRQEREQLRQHQEEFARKAEEDRKRLLEEEKQRKEKDERDKHTIASVKQNGDSIQVYSVKGHVMFVRAGIVQGWTSDTVTVKYGNSLITYNSYGAVIFRR